MQQYRKVAENKENHGQGEFVLRSIAILSLRCLDRIVAMIPTQVRPRSNRDVWWLCDCLNGSLERPSVGMNSRDESDTCGGCAGKKWDVSCGCDRCFSGQFCPAYLLGK